MINRNTVKTRFTEYVEHYDASDPKVRLKIIHTEQVAKICDAISAGIGLPESDRDLAWLTGMLHDIGRFEQLRRYHTFFDRISVNHAQLSADLLFRDGLIRSFTEPSADDPLIEKVIRLHNVFALPDGLTERERMFCGLLRDADKIDIMRVNCETPLNEIYDMPEESFRTTRISDDVFRDAVSCQNVNREHSKTAVDYMVGHICFVFGLVYPVSIKLVKEQGYLDRMLDFHSEVPETEERLKEIRETVQLYLKKDFSKAFFKPNFKTYGQK